MTVRIVNYLGEVVIQRTLPILSAKQRVQTQTRELVGWMESWVRAVVDQWVDGEYRLGGKGTYVGSEGDPATAHSCIPRWGVETATQRGVFLFTIATFLFVIFAMPFLVVSSLVLVGIYYLYIEKDMRRRRRFEAQRSNRMKND